MAEGIKTIFRAADTITRVGRQDPSFEGVEIFARCDESTMTMVPIPLSLGLQSFPELKEFDKTTLIVRCIRDRTNRVARVTTYLQSLKPSNPAARIPIGRLYVTDEEGVFGRQTIPAPSEGDIDSYDALGLGDVTRPLSDIDTLRPADDVQAIKYWAKLAKLALLVRRPTAVTTTTP